MDKKKECSKCGGKMKKGIYLAQTIAYGAMKKIKRLQGSGVVTIWNGGPGKIKPCKKCERCGRSVTL